MIIKKATKNDAQRTLFKFLVKTLDNVPISKIEKIFRKNDVKVNGNRKIDKKYLVQENDEIIIYGIEQESKKIDFSNKQIIINFHKIYEDNNILIVNKKANVSIHSEENCLDEQVLHYLKAKKEDSFLPSHISRIDKATSGIVVYAKNYATLRQMVEKQKHFEKIYILKSDFPFENKIVEFYLKKDEKKQKMIVDANSGELSKTQFFTENYKKYARIFTGKKHQIRVSLSKLGFPIYGDKKYGGKKAERLFLHSYRIKFLNLDGELKYLNDKEFISYPKW